MTSVTQTNNTTRSIELIHKLTSLWSTFSYHLSNFSKLGSQSKSEKMAGVVDFPSKEYGYVALVLTLYCFLNFWMSAKVGLARKKYKVFYPTLYATEAENKDAKLFNCVQRGHQNSLELMPIFFMLMIVGGMKHPIICASLGFFYIITRYFYFTGYATGDPQKRLTIGKYGFLAIFGLIGCTISFGVHLLIA
ncbi:hypothetical protein LguiA_005523 [Lonicera macranthoides]